MRNPNRIPIILNKLKLVWEKYPDLRFNQLINALNDKQDNFYMEDKKFESLLDKWIEISNKNKNFK